MTRAHILLLVMVMAAGVILMMSTTITASPWFHTPTTINNSNNGNGNFFSELLSSTTTTRYDPKSTPQEARCHDMMDRLQNGKNFTDLIHLDRFIIAFNTNSDVPIAGSYYGARGLVNFAHRLDSMVKLVNTTISYAGTNTLNGLCALRITTHFESKQNGKHTWCDDSDHDHGDDDDDHGKPIELYLQLKELIGTDKYIAARFDWPFPHEYWRAAQVLNWDTQLNVRYLALGMVKRGYRDKKLLKKFFTKDTIVELDSQNSGKHTWKGETALADYMDWMATAHGCPAGHDHHDHHHHDHHHHHHGANHKVEDVLDKFFSRFADDNHPDNNNNDPKTRFDESAADHWPDDERTKFFEFDFDSNNNNNNGSDHDNNNNIEAKLFSPDFIILDDDDADIDDTDADDILFVKEYDDDEEGEEDNDGLEFEPETTPVDTLRYMRKPSFGRSGHRHHPSPPRTNMRTNYNHLYRPFATEDDEREKEGDIINKFNLNHLTTTNTLTTTTPNHNHHPRPHPHPHPHPHHHHGHHHHHHPNKPNPHCAAFPIAFPYITLADPEYANKNLAIYHAILAPRVMESQRYYINNWDLGKLYTYAPVMRIHFVFDDAGKITNLSFIDLDGLGFVHGGNWREGNRSRHHHHHHCGGNDEKNGVGCNDSDSSSSNNPTTMTTATTTPIAIAAAVVDGNDEHGDGNTNHIIDHENNPRRHRRQTQPQHRPYPRGTGGNNNDNNNNNNRHRRRGGDSNNTNNRNNNNN